MEYRGYTPCEVKKDKRKYKLFIILLMFPMLFGLIFIIGGVVEFASIRVDDVSTISYNAMSETDVYYFDEMVLVDIFAFYGDTTTGYAEENYFLVCFVDGDGKRVYTSIVTETYSELNEKCEAFVDDDSLSVGDLILSGCFHGYRNGSLVQCYFEDAYELYNAEMPGEMLAWNFRYDDAETIKDYRADRASGLYIMFFMGALFVVPCGIGITVLVRKRKELDRYLAEYNNEPYAL